FFLVPGSSPRLSMPPSAQCSCSWSYASFAAVADGKGVLGPIARLPNQGIQDPEERRRIRLSQRVRPLLIDRSTTPAVVRAGPFFSNEEQRRTRSPLKTEKRRSSGRNLALGL